MSDGQLTLRLPREIRERVRAITRITGDRGLDKLALRLLQAELARIEGAHVGVIVDQAQADRILRAAGQEPPAIPAGANTAQLFFQTAEGRHALAVNQTGFERTAADAEPVNGCTVLVLEGNVTAEEAGRLLDNALHQLLT